MTQIKIIENDSQLMTVRVDSRVLVYNKEYGTWYDGDAIVTLPDDIVNRIREAAEYSNQLIEDLPGYVYHPDDSIF